LTGYKRIAAAAGDSWHPLEEKKGGEAERTIKGLWGRGGSEGASGWIHVLLQEGVRQHCWCDAHRTGSRSKPTGASKALSFLQPCTSFRFPHGHSKNDNSKTVTPEPQPRPHRAEHTTVGLELRDKNLAADTNAIDWGSLRVSHHA
jgi:hypothetical protein